MFKLIHVLKHVPLQPVLYSNGVIAVVKQNIPTRVNITPWVTANSVACCDIIVTIPIKLFYGYIHTLDLLAFAPIGKEIERAE